MYCRDEEGRTPLHCAAAADNNSDQLVAMLIAAGADLNPRDEDGETPLHYAAGAHYNYDEVVAMLIDTGVYNPKDRSEHTPLQCVAAAHHNSNQLVAMLIDAGADINPRNSRYVRTLITTNVHTCRMYI